VILRAARSSRALDSPLTCPRSRSSRSRRGWWFDFDFEAEGEVHPQADDLQERWLQLVHKA
jgi:hypothetical protein